MLRLLSLAAALYCFTAALWGASCLPPVFCYLAPSADVIFTGVAVEGLDRATRYRVSRAFKGVSEEDTVEIGNAFEAVELGQRYLVFGRRANGRLGSLECGGVWPIAKAAEPLRYLERWLAGNTPNQVMGRLALNAAGQPQVYRRFQRLVPSASVEIAGEEGPPIRLRPNAQGDFAATVPKPGRYKVSAVLPRWISEPPVREVLVPERGCAATTVWLRPDGQVAGQAVSATGAPAAGVLLKLGDMQTVTGARGEFLFRGVLPGRYQLGVNPGDVPTPQVPYRSTLYRDPQDKTSPAAITVGWYENVSLSPFRLPPRIGTRTIRVRVTTSAGQPLDGASLSYSVEGGTSWGVPLRGKSSPISFEGMDGLGYIVSVSLPGRPSKKLSVPAGRGPVELKAVFAAP